MTRQRKHVRFGHNTQVSSNKNEETQHMLGKDEDSDEQRVYSHLQHALESHRKRKVSLSKRIFTVFVGIFVVGILVSVGVLAYNGYLETRVNTPFDKHKVVGRSGLSVPDRYWGSYRPGTYFGMKTREPHSPVVGLLWYFNSHLFSGKGGIRHWCEQGDNLKGYGWKEHDGRTFGVQDIIDGPFNITTSFIKRRSGRRGGDWTAHIEVSSTAKEDVSEEVSLFLYLALDEKTTGRISTSTTSTGMDGYTKELGDFTVRLRRFAGEIDHISHLSTQVPGLNKIKEAVEGSLRMVTDKVSNKRLVVLPGLLLRPTQADPNPHPNLIVHKVDAKVPFTLEVVYRSGAIQDQDLKVEDYEKELRLRRSAFSERFQNTFRIKDKGFNETMQQFAMTSFSNLVGGIGYFYGSSSVQSHLNTIPVPYWKAPLYTAVPSRSFFPRGFLWDEGFHDLLLLPWDIEVVLDIMCHWFDLMNVQGWIPREQILGSEALAKVPQEFVVQQNTNANPPTFFITLHFMLCNYKDRIIENHEHLDSLERLFPRLQAWFSWFNTTQIGKYPQSYRWRGRDAESKRELNPKTLTSGLDDYPRASHPSEEERHLDLRCWLALGAGVMAEIAELLGHETKHYDRTHEMLTENGLLNELHWSESKKRYADYGLHTDSVTLVRPPPAPRSQHSSSELVRAVRKEPELRFVDSHFGYVSLFPVLLHILEPDSPMLEKVLRDIRKPELLWTKYGLRSLATTSPLYNKRNTEHDPPYWRGDVWININYLACRAFYHYGNVEGPNKKLANDIYVELRSNIISNIYKQYKATGFIWERYNDKTGEGKGAHPFNGWSSLVTLIMAEMY